MNPSPQKPVVVLTGTSQGIGAALSIQCEKVFDVIRVGRHFSNDVEGVQWDLTQPFNTAVAKQLRAHLAGRSVFAIVYCAGVVTPIGESPPNDERQLLQFLQARDDAWRVNYLSLQSLCEFLLPYLSAHDTMGAARVAHLSTGAAQRNYEGMETYCLTKAAALSYFKVLSQRADFVNHFALSVAPGTVQTQMMDRVMGVDAAKFKDFQKFQELKDQGGLVSPAVAAQKVFELLFQSTIKDLKEWNGAFVDVRKLRGVLAIVVMGLLGLYQLTTVAKPNDSQISKGVEGESKGQGVFFSTAGNVSAKSADLSKPEAKKKYLLHTDSAKMRMRAEMQNPSEITFRFRYLGSTAQKSKLLGGQTRVQLGVFLASENQCNAIYVMWRQSSQTLVVQSKINPSQSTHAQCLNNGYTTLKPDASQRVPVLVENAEHTLSAKIIAKKRLEVMLDGRLVWAGPVPQLPQNPKYVGIRSDNTKMQFEVLSAELQNESQNESEDVLAKKTKTAVDSGR